MREKLVKRIAEKFDIPAEAMSSATKVTVTGDRRVLVENHRGLLEYGGDTVAINGGGMRVRLLGEGLELKSMNAGELLITGRLLTVTFE